MDSKLPQPVVAPSNYGKEGLITIAEHRMGHIRLRLVMRQRRFYMIVDNDGVSPPFFQSYKIADTLDAEGRFWFDVASIKEGGF